MAPWFVNFGGYICTILVLLLQEKKLFADFLKLFVLVCVICAANCYRCPYSDSLFFESCFVAFPHILHNRNCFNFFKEMWD